MEAARHRGHKVAAIIAGVLGYYRSLDAKRDGGKFVMGLHRLIQKDRFLTFVPSNVVSLAEATPWPGRMRGWVKNQYWNTVDWGPKPGRDGCEVPPEFLSEVG